MKTMLKATFLAAVLAASINLAHSEPTNTPQFSKAKSSRWPTKLIPVRNIAHLQTITGRNSKLRPEGPVRNAGVGAPEPEYDRVGSKVSKTVDSSRNRFDYFRYEAEEMSRQASLYENFAAKAQ